MFLEEVGISITAIAWFFSILSIGGTFLLTQGSIHGFTVGVIANGAFFCINLYHKDYAQAFLFLVNFAVSVYGVYAWNKNHTKMAKNRAG